MRDLWRALKGNSYILTDSFPLEKTYTHSQLIQKDVNYSLLLGDGQDYFCLQAVDMCNKKTCERRYPS